MRTLILALVLCASVYGQTADKYANQRVRGTFIVDGTSKPLPVVAETLPVSCTENEFVFRVSNLTFYRCSATNVWTAAVSTDATGVPNGNDGDFQLKLGSNFNGIPPGPGIVVDASVGLDETNQLFYSTGTAVPGSCTRWGLLFFKTDADTGYFCNGATYVPMAGLSAPPSDDTIPMHTTGGVTRDSTCSDVLLTGCILDGGQLPAEAAKINAANTFNAGSKQTMQPSVSTAGLRIVCGVLPSGPAEGDIACDSGASNVLKQYRSGTWQELGGGGASFDPTDMSSFWFRDELGSGPTPDGWVVTNLSTGGTGGSGTVNVGSITGAPGVFELRSNATPTGSGSGAVMTRMQSGATSANINPSDLTSLSGKFKTRFKLDTSVSDVRFKAGLCGQNITGLSSVQCIQVRYDTSAAFDDDNAAGAGQPRFVGQLCTTVCDDTSGNVVNLPTAPTTGWHTLEITFGPTITMRIDADAPVTFCSSGCDALISAAPTAGVSPHVAFATDTNAARTVYIDYVAMKLEGLTR